VQQGRAKLLFRFCLGGDVSRLVDQLPVFHLALPLGPVALRGVAG
jgi:hypothetical protein